jgi:hypothetical protein
LITQNWLTSFQLQVYFAWSFTPLICCAPLWCGSTVFTTFLIQFIFTYDYINVMTD